MILTTPRPGDATAAKRGRRTPRRPRRPPRRTPPSLRFTPYAWAKLLFLRDAGPTEVGGFGVSSEIDPLLVEDLRLVRQSCSAVTVRFDDAAVADHFDACVDAGLPPERFARVWVHTHPGDCPRPSGTDERTFAKAFGGCDWAVMFVLARGGASYARLRFSAGPGGDLTLPVEVDYSEPFPASDAEAWADEYARCVAPAAASSPEAASSPGSASSPESASSPGRRDLSAALVAPGEECWPSSPFGAGGSVGPDDFWPPDAVFPEPVLAEPAFPDATRSDPFFPDLFDWEFRDEHDRDDDDGTDD